MLAPRRAYDLWSATYDREDGVFLGLEAEATTAVLPPLAGRCVLDLGCGTGRWLRGLSSRGARVFGVDASLGMLARARAEGGSVSQASAETGLPIRDSVFDTVVAALVLGHVADLAGALREIDRVLRPGGSLVLSDFHPDAARAGWARTFRATLSEGAERSFRVEHHARELAEVDRLLAVVGRGVVARKEVEWGGRPVVFALRAETLARP